MNKENLQRMADYVRTIPQEKFHMRFLRSGDKKTHACNSVGCVLGHCTILDKENELPRDDFLGSIAFFKWAEIFTGITDSDILEFLFSEEWYMHDNTPTGAADRIEFVIADKLYCGWMFDSFIEGWRARNGGNL